MPSNFKRGLHSFLETICVFYVKVEIPTFLSITVCVYKLFCLYV